MTVPDSTHAEIADACAAAGRAAGPLAWASPEKIARLLRGAAAELESIADELVSTADRETSLGESRLRNELGRTSGQFRAFADLVASDGHTEPVVSPATESTPDVRRMLVPAGPVAVFGASNFPLAFSVPGGDTASALAAGCPVVAKGHPSHPETSRLCAEAISRAVNHAGLPDATFSMVQGASPQVGHALVTAPEIRAVGFTGSHAGGRALYELAARRPVPIPVYAEMGSLNPALVTAAALERRGDDIASELAGSVILGCGQFCTKPGLILTPPSEGFVRRLSEAIASVAAAPMLNEGIARGFTQAVERTSGLEGVEILAGEPGPGHPVLMSTTIDVFVQRPELVEEHFGPGAVLVGCPEDRMSEALSRIEGTLAVSVYAEESDDELVRRLMPELVRRAGRIVFDGPPTGVAVVPAMVHGGPYPSTTFPAHSSVGLSAMRRFQRPVAFQNAPQRWLPDPLRNQG